MQSIAFELEAIIDQHTAALHAMLKDKMTDKPSPTKWSKKEISELTTLFSAFKDLPIQVTVDSKQLASLETEKLKDFLQSMKQATIGKFRVAYPWANQSDNTLPISEENLKLIKIEFPNTVIEQAQYADSSGQLAERLSNAVTTSKISSKVNQNEKLEEKKRIRSHL